MRKRDSKRRWKARIDLGQRVPWSAVVEHKLHDYTKWERAFDTMTARKALPDRDPSEWAPLVYA